MSKPNVYVLPIIPKAPPRNSRSLGLRHKFTKEEDKKLKELVQELGTKNWKEVAQRMVNRSSRQCRERYKNYLSDNAKNGPWTPEEEALLEDKYNKYGPRWAMIAGFFDSRSDANVKNHWTNIVTRRKREKLKFAVEANEGEPSVIEKDEIFKFDANNITDFNFGFKSELPDYYSFQGDDFFDF